ncbi:MAG: ATP-binding cassette domain-containing protein [Candidatus Caenarcaniphilales bacterium]|nr:ATP-binding cassette domain-containing protein [Candidatus Caenarcaniphilales bacterium]
MSKKALIELKDIHLSFGDRKILNGVSLKVYPGEIAAILGPSGAGKSTIIKIIAGLLEPDSGEVIVRSDKIGFAFQYSALFSAYTVKENIELVLEQTTNLPYKEINERVKNSLKMVNLSHVQDLYPNQISGGMQKRVGIARALAIDPKVMLYDEPSAGLDPIVAHKLEEDLTRINSEKGLASVLITHELPTIKNLATKVLMLFEGEFVYKGTTNDFFYNCAEPFSVQFRNRRLAGPISV